MRDPAFFTLGLVMVGVLSKAIGDKRSLEAELLRENARSAHFEQK